jgi:hypothetical protein
MAEIKRFDGQVVVDYQARDYDSLLRAMREQIPYKLPEWTEYESEGDFGNVLLQLFAHMGDVLSYYQDRVANESFLGTAQTRRSVIHHLGLIGYRLSTASPAAASLTLAFPADCTETVLIRRGDAFATKSTEDGPSVRFEYTSEVPQEIVCGDLVPVEAMVEGEVKTVKLVTGVPVEEGLLIEGEVLGTSDGTPSQRFPLAHAGLILGSAAAPAINRDLILQTELGGLITEWTHQETLAFSRASQTDYVVEIDADDRATVVFGDGEFGAIPSAGAVIRVSYRIGGGAHGNVPKHSIATITDAPQLTLLGVKVWNPTPATGGAARESIAHAVQHAPAVFRSLHRAVTRDDYEALALRFGGVGKVQAEATNWNTVTLYVAPEGGGEVSDVLRFDLLAYFEDLRPLSTIIKVESVAYLEVFVTANVEVVSYYSQEQVAEEVRAVAGALLAFDAVDFGQALNVSKFYEAIEAIDGVESVFISEFRSETAPAGTMIEENGRIQPALDEVPVAAAAYDGVRVIANGGF